MAEFSGARVLVVMNNTVLSFDDWVKIASCHHCGEKGHICPNYPKFKAGLPKTDRRPTGDFLQ